jgi:hypothetical protein
VTGLVQADDARRAAGRRGQRLLAGEAALGQELDLLREALVPVEGRSRVGPRGDAHTGAVRHPNAFTMAIGDGTGPLDDDRIENGGLLEERMDR